MKSAERVDHALRGVVGGAKKETDRMKKKRYSQEFKDDAVRLWIKSGKSADEAARSVGVTTRSLRRWKSQAHSEMDGKALGDGATMKPSEMEAEIRRLRKEMREMQEQREIYQRHFPTIAEARGAIFDYIETFYNRHRQHSALDGFSPHDFEIENFHPPGGMKRPTPLPRVQLEQKRQTKSTSAPHVSDFSGKVQCCFCFHPYRVGRAPKRQSARQPTFSLPLWDGCV